MELKDLVKYYVPMRMEGSSPPNWEVVFGYDISKFKGYNVDEVRVALNLTQLWLSQGPRAKQAKRRSKVFYRRVKNTLLTPPLQSTLPTPTRKIQRILQRNTPWSSTALDLVPQQSALPDSHHEKNP